MSVVLIEGLGGAQVAVSPVCGWCLGRKAMQRWRAVRSVEIHRAESRAADSISVPDSITKFTQ